MATAGGGEPLLLGKNGVVPGKKAEGERAPWEELEKFWAPSMGSGARAHGVEDREQMRRTMGMGRESWASLKFLRAGEDGSLL
jgi:hypothetical protein